MKKLISLFLFSSFLNAQVDWSDPNDCKLSDNSEFINILVSQMSLEQKVGQIIMPEIIVLRLMMLKNIISGLF